MGKGEKKNSIPIPRHDFEKIILLFPIFRVFLKKEKKLKKTNLKRFKRILLFVARGWKGQVENGRTKNAHRKSMNHRPRIYFRWNEILRNRRGRLWRPRKTHFVFPLRGPLARFVCWNFTRGSLTHLVFPDSVENIIYMCSLSGDWLANFPLSKSSPLLSISFYFSTRVSFFKINPTFINLTQFQLTRFISNKLYYILIFI